MTVKKYRKLHKRCRTCKYADNDRYRWVCMAKNKVGTYHTLEKEGLTGILCPMYEPKGYGEYTLFNELKEGDYVWSISKECDTNLYHCLNRNSDKIVSNPCEYYNPPTKDTEEMCNSNYEHTYCSYNLDVLCKNCVDRLVVNKEKFMWGMLPRVVGVPMYDVNTPIECRVYMTEKEAKDVVNWLKIKVSEYND